MDQQPGADCQAEIVKREMRSWTRSVRSFGKSHPEAKESLYFYNSPQSVSQVLMRNNPISPGKGGCLQGEAWQLLWDTRLHLAELWEKLKCCQRLAIEVALFLRIPNKNHHWPRGSCIAMRCLQTQEQIPWDQGLVIFAPWFSLLQ